MTTLYAFRVRDGRVEQRVRYDTLTKTEFGWVEEPSLTTEDLGPCGCKACPCDITILRERLVCEACWEYHHQYDFIRVPTKREWIE